MEIWTFRPSLNLFSNLSLNFLQILGCYRKSQDTENGGISDRPDDAVDVYHTHFGIAGMQLSSLKIMINVGLTFKFTFSYLPLLIQGCWNQIKSLLTLYILFFLFLNGIQVYMHSFDLY